jgi:probable HAF family extracellular repeat protein
MCGPDSVTNARLCSDERGVDVADGALKSTRHAATDGAPPYAIISLGTLGGPSSIALGINDLGQVVGGADTSEGKRHAFLWDAGAMRDIGTPPGTTISEAWDVNDLCQVVGVALGSTRSPMHAFFWEEAQGMLDLGHLGGGEASARAINNGGIVVGYSASSHGYSQAFVWDGEIMTPIPSAFGGVRSTASDINDAGQVAGGASTVSEDLRAFLWKDGVMQDLGTLGGDFSRARSVNDLGGVVGFSERAPPNDTFMHAFSWESDQMTDLGMTGGFLESYPWAINNNGQIVGDASRDGPRLGFLYDPDSGMSDLTALVSPNSGWSILMPQDINDRGQIVGDGAYGGQWLAFLMTPLDTDFDDNGQTGLEDYAIFHDCLTGPGLAVDDSCQACDVNRDGAVDLRDVQPFQWTSGGP